MQDCCPSESPTKEQKSFDWLLFGSASIILLVIILPFLITTPDYVSKMAYSLITLLKKMWWGIVFGIIAIGLMNKVPRAYFQAIIGRGNNASGLLRAIVAGIFLDLCSHGILMIGAKLYERGISTAQVIAFLIASPWNSFSLTLILIALIGLPGTLLFIFASAVIAFITGYCFMILCRKGILPENPHQADDSETENFEFKKQIKSDLKQFKFSSAFFKDVIKDGVSGAQMILRWLLFGTLIAALIQTFVSVETLQQYFGPTIGGLFLTLIATTVIEVCSEGSAPIGADLFNRAAAPGNAFTFLMAGVATDYTEILIIREFSKSWKIALFLPLITVPQILFIGWIMNVASQNL